MRVRVRAIRRAKKFTTEKRLYNLEYVVIDLNKQIDNAAIFLEDVITFVNDKFDDYSERIACIEEKVNQKFTIWDNIIVFVTLGLLLVASLELFRCIFYK
jgi:hypothetical protein